MAQPSYFWHDYETFGTNPRRDRPAQFAGIRTDEQLNIIGKPVNIYCQPALDILPHPQAVMVTGITPQKAQANGMPEPEFIERILEELGAPGTCGVGYNSLNFDDEVTRFTAWRNFYSPYDREWRDGCSRWDLINTVRLTYALRPHGINWPERTDEPGVPSFRLEDLAAANQLNQEHAHDALSDVYATIDLARLIYTKKPKLWAWVHAHRNKHDVNKQIDLLNHTALLHVSQMIPARLGCLSPIMPLMRHPVNKNAIICYDLRYDPKPLLALSAQALAERLFTPKQDLPEGTERVAIKNIAVNKCPILAPYKMLDAPQADRLAINLEQCEKYWQHIKDNLETIGPKLSKLFAPHQTSSNGDPETALYAGFTSNADRQTCREVTQADAQQLASDQFYFEDNRLNEILFRYRARHFADTLNTAERQEWQEHVATQLQSAPDGGLTLDDYNTAIETELQFVADEPEKLKLLLELKTWGQQLEFYLDSAS